MGGGGVEKGEGGLRGIICTKTTVCRIFKWDGMGRGGVCYIGEAGCMVAESGRSGDYGCQEDSIRIASHSFVAFDGS
jgi:hypothetical protein